jgi:galactokinase
MTAQSLADRLVERGFDPLERDAKISLFDCAVSAFEAAVSAPPEHAWWVPGRLEVFGKHTDYAGGRTLVAATPRGFAVAARARVDDVVRVVDGRTSEEVSLRSTQPADRSIGWRNYVDVVVRRLARNFPQCPLGADIAVASDLPPAAGMSSSSALMVAVETALVEVSGIESSAQWRSNIQSILDRAGYYGCVENGSGFGTLDGDPGVGTHGGSEDHAAILAGRVDHLTALSFVPMREIATVPVPDDWSFVLAPSGIAAEKTGAARELYNRLSHRARALLELWNAVEPHAASLGAALASNDAAPRLREIVRSTPVDGLSVESLESRLDHFIREDSRIPQALDAFAARDAAALERLSRASQEDAETLLGNQIPETVALAARARDMGALGACSFGAGFGGSVWALVSRRDAPAFANAWHPGAFVARPGPGLSKLT